MFWGKKTSLGIAMALVVGAVASTPALAETIVVRASGPSAKGFPPGKKLADTGTVALKAGDVVTLLDGRGTRTLRGPGTFGLTASASAGTDSRNSLASLLETKRVRRARTGAVRGGITEDAPAPRSPNLWYVDISQPSTACVPDPANVQLWRPDLGSAVAVTITSASGGASAPVNFAAGEAVAAWPSSLLVSEGARYRLSWSGLAKPVDISFALLGANAGGLETMASTLIAKKCDAQLALLAETVALPDPAPDSP